MSDESREHEYLDMIERDTDNIYKLKQKLQAAEKEIRYLVGVLDRLDKDSLIPFKSRQLIYQALEKVRGEE